MLPSAVRWRRRGAASSLFALVGLVGLALAGLGACSDFGAEDGASEGSDAGGGSDVASGETSLPDGATVDAEAGPCDPATLAADKFNCGACGHVCEASCSDGRCEPQALDGTLNIPSGAHLAVDDKAIFVSDKGGIYQCNNPGFGGSCDWVTAADTLVSSAPNPIAISPKRLFWGESGLAANTASSLWSRPRDGVMLNGTQSDAPSAFALGANADGTTVVLIDSTNSRNVYAINCELSKCGSASLLGQSGRAVSGNEAGVCYLGTYGQNPFGLVCNANGSGALSVPVAQDSLGLAVGKDAVFVVSPGGIYSVSRSAATSNIAQLGTLGGTGPIAVDGDSVYYAGAYNIYRCSAKDCSAPTMLSDRVGKTVMELGVGGDYVYFLESDPKLSNLSLLRIPK